MNHLTRIQIYLDQPFPVVLLDNFLKDKVGRNLTSYYELLAQWAGWLVENQIAHVVVVGSTGQRGSGEVGVLQALGRALPTKTVEVIPLCDMTESKAKQYLQLKLKQQAQFRLTLNARPNAIELEEEEIALIVRTLGGRASDLEAISSKLADGKSVQNSLEEMIHKAMLEIQKHGLVGTSWTPAQFWYILRQLSSPPSTSSTAQSQQTEFNTLSFDQIRFSTLFNGKDTPILDMERAELLTLSYVNGRPTSIRLNKPLYVTAVQRMVRDEQFKSANDVIMYKAMCAAENEKVKQYEDEYALLSESIGQMAKSRRSIDNAIEQRMNYISKLISDSQTKINDWMNKLDAAKKKL